MPIVSPKSKKKLRKVCTACFALQQDLKREEKLLLFSIFISSDFSALRITCHKISDTIGNQLVGPSCLGLLHLLLVELHRLPGTRGIRPHWRLQNRLGDGKFSRRRLWRLFAKQLVHETRFSVFDHTLLGWHWGCWRSKGGARKRYQFVRLMYDVSYFKVS